ncbi:MAG TPA: ATP-binding protein, partial [Pseudonocardia sp.]|uniref:sensor histidine kinase n=1 Tax=Pseudonocardia sp. TaxID=60912 RepID=UPI002BEAC52F
PALAALARRSAVPVELDVDVPARLPEQLEVAAYYVVSEALTNVAKHAQATAAQVELRVSAAGLHLSVRDDGIGGAAPGSGSGLIGLIDRVEAVGGTISLTSSTGQGTALVADLPVDGRDSC